MVLPERRETGGVRRMRMWAAVGLVGVSACAPEGASAQGRDISDLYRLFVYVAIGVGAIVYGLILWSAIRYRRRSDALPKQTGANVPLEIVYTALPILIVLGLFVLTFRVERDVDRVAAEPALVVNVSGFQWGWRFEYPESGISVVSTPSEYPTLVLPAGETVRINLSSNDVIHSFYVPDFLFKRDTVPGQPNRFDLLIPEPGRFRGACAEFCGVDHGEMNFWVDALPATEFDAWIEERAGAS